MVLGIKVDPVVVDQGRQHRAVSRQGADDGVDHHS